MTDPTPPDPEPGEPASAPEIAPADAMTIATSVATPEATAPPDATTADPLPPEPPWPSDTPALEGHPSGGRRLPRLGYVGALACGVVIGVAGLALVSGAISAAAPSPTPVPTEEPTTAPAVSPVGNSFGEPDAPVTIEVWADYQCPYCRLEDLLFGGAIDREYIMPGVARVVYRDFAFLGQESTDAAVASRCAGAQDPAAQLRYHDTLYTFQQGENEGRFARANLVAVAGIAGVPDPDAFTACLDDPAVAQAVEDETAAGRAVGVASTPTLRMRGPGGERVLTGFSQAWPPLRDAIEAVRVAAPASPSPAGSFVPSASDSPSPTP